MGSLEGIIDLNFAVSDREILELPDPDKLPWLPVKVDERPGSSSPMWVVVGVAMAPASSWEKDLLSA